MAALALPGSVVSAQYRVPPLPVPLLPLEGEWFFRGDPSQPCLIRAVPSPAGRLLVFTNEKGTPAMGWLSRDGRRVTIPDWNLVGKITPNRIIWPNGDFWGR
jgi:hypothetical protein